MSDADQSFLDRVALRNLVILAVLLVLSLPWRSAALSLGILVGGLLALGGFWWQQRTLRRVLEQPTPQAARGFQVRYFLRLAGLGLILYVLIGRLGLHPVGLTLGLSVVVINIFCTALARLVRRG
ncbi:ATP synthase subunit I [Geoalkalibacter sp.]|uniref:ATP synthase subunit I n=1 Tax=Geoalkalibacter sp. TaxID=3041440 RepID=UPI00272DFBBB|nr:ATP synthase subunit I [Geoalkalibacter sp.]